MAESLPLLLPVEEIERRLQRIFPAGIENRDYCTRMTSVRTVFVMLYVGAVEGTDRFVRPNQVTRMTTAQAKRATPDSRQRWAEDSLKSGGGEIKGRWYADNTREPIRDETIRTGLIPNNAVFEREGLPTNSSKPKYALRAEFSRPFHPALTGLPLQQAIEVWQKDYLSKSAIARAALLRNMTVAGGSQITVRFPNGEARNLPPGPSSVIAKAVIEEFAARFLGRPAVVHLADGRRRVVARDEEIAREIGITFPPDRLLPDALIVDLAPEHPLLVYVEIVATDGPVNELRKSELMRATESAGFSPDRVAFVTAYADRDHPAFKKTVGSLAWGTFAWFVSEPAQILVMQDRNYLTSGTLSDLLQLGPGSES
jgi:hypothetical protein